MAAEYRSLDEKSYESRYLLLDTVIDHPVERVWPHALNIGGWMSDHGLETLAGEPGKVGHFERVFPKGLGDDIPRPHYHVYGVAEIIPMKYIALEVFRERGGSYGHTRDGMAFDNIVLTDLSGRTKLTFIQIEVHLGERQKNDEAWQQQLQRDEAIILERLRKYFDNLKQLVQRNES
jgi:hypothetical protein